MEAVMKKKRKSSARSKARRIDEANLVMSLKDSCSGIYDFENDLAEFVEKDN